MLLHRSLLSDLLEYFLHFDLHAVGQDLHRGIVDSRLGLKLHLDRGHMLRLDSVGRRDNLVQYEDLRLMP